MGYLGVDIHENVVITGTGVDDKGFWGIDFSTKVNTENMFDAFETGEAVEADTVTIKLFKFSLTGYQDKPKTAPEIGTDINGLKNQLVDILKTQMPKADAEAKISAAVMFAGLGVTPGDKTLANKLLNQQFIDGVFNNIINAFTAAMTPFFGQNPFRMKLVRQSKNKHFPKFPKRGKANTWIESMQVPADATKVVWSEYELKNKLNDGTPVATDQAPTEAVEAVENMFGGGEATTAETPVNTETPSTETNPFAQ